MAPQGAREGTGFHNAMGELMLDRDTIAAAARALNHAEKTRQQIGQLSIEHPSMTIDDSYAIQRAWMALRLAETMPDPRIRPVARRGALDELRRGGVLAALSGQDAEKMEGARLARNDAENFLSLSSGQDRIGPQQGTRPPQGGRQ